MVSSTPDRWIKRLPLKAIEAAPRLHIAARAWAAPIAVLVSGDACAKDVGGVIIIGFIFGGGVAGVVVGAVSALVDRLRFWRGAVLLLPASLLSWLALLVYWKLPLTEKGLISNLPLMILVLMGSVPMYLVAYWVARVFRRY